MAETLTAFRDLFCDQQPFADLNEKYKDLVNILVGPFEKDGAREMLESHRSKILLFAAIFHDDDENALLDGMQHKPGSTDTDAERMLQLTRFRDMLFFVGAYALQLCITTELFQRYPEANESALHTLRARAIVDDLVVYIMFKADIHKTIYRMDPEIIANFKEIMYTADCLGMDVWRDRGGWVLPGGTDEFARRCRMGARAPQYPGCAGGRLYGKKNKLDLKYTEETLFAMKAIIGALVLSSGMERMWQFIGPLFEEVMLLSPKESLQVYKDSTIK